MLRDDAVPFADTLIAYAAADFPLIRAAFDFASPLRFFDALLLPAI